jgi:DNA-binding transcriptional regulator YhcF (GntR family)
VAAAFRRGFPPRRGAVLVWSGHGHLRTCRRHASPPWEGGAGSPSRRRLKESLVNVDNIVNRLATCDGLPCRSMLGLDPDDARPPYVQVVDALRRQIDEGGLPPGAKLPTHEQLASQFGVSIGTIKRALGELQGASVIVSRQGQGAFVRTRRSLLDSVPQSFSAETLAGLWATSYKFKLHGGIFHHADITRITAKTSRRLTARNYPPDPQTEGHVPSFRNDIEAQLANRHVIGQWRNVSDTRYFGSLHLAVLTGEAVMEGYYTGFTSDIEVDVGRWKWVRLDPLTVSGVELAEIVLKEPEAVYGVLERSNQGIPLPLAAIADGQS